MKRAVCFYSPGLFVEHRVFELYSHGALGQCLVSDVSQFPSCNCISQPCIKTWVIFAFHGIFFQDCITLCNQGNSHTTFCLGPSRCFLPAFFSWKGWWPVLTPFHKRTIARDPAGHLHEELCSWENLIQKRTASHHTYFWHGT